MSKTIAASIQHLRCKGLSFAEASVWNREQRPLPVVDRLGEVYRPCRETTISSGWASVATAPRDGTPVILWMIEDETPPEVPLTVGFWTLNPKAGIGYWRIFGDPPRFCSDQANPWLAAASPGVRGCPTNLRHACADQRETLSASPIRSG